MNDYTKTRLMVEERRPLSALLLLTVFFAGVLSGAALYRAAESERLSSLPFFGKKKVVSEKEIEITPTVVGEGVPITAIAEGKNTLVAGNQPAGEHVLVSLISLSQSGWVAVHEVLPDGTPGTILGARRLVVGEYFAETVELLRGTESGIEYMIVLHADDGDGEFDFEREMPVTDSLGEFVTAHFIAL